MNLINIGESENLRESEEQRVRSCIDNDGRESGRVGCSSGLLDEVIDEFRLSLFDIHGGEWWTN
jgi:hypothetical protein